jgi:hypothetical protein
VIELVKAKAKLSAKTGQWTLDLKKFAFNHGSHTFETADVEGFRLVVNGTTYFDPATRDTAIVKTKTNPKLGDKVFKFTIKEANGNKVTVDLKKSTIKVKLKAAPAFDPTAGDVTVEIHLPGLMGSLTSTPEILGKKLNKANLAPAEGSFKE